MIKRFMNCVIIDNDAAHNNYWAKYMFVNNVSSFVILFFLLMKMTTFLIDAWPLKSGVLFGMEIELQIMSPGWNKRILSEL